MARLVQRIVQPRWAASTDIALLIARVAIGAFLIWGVWDNIQSSARMAEFAGFLAAHEFPFPAIAAPLSVYTQFLAGVGLILGLATRWAALLCIANFIVAVVMVDGPNGIRAAFPATALILFGLIFASIGAGRFALDPMLWRGRHR